MPTSIQSTAIRINNNLGVANNSGNVELKKDFLHGIIERYEHQKNDPPKSIFNTLKKIAGTTLQEAVIMGSAMAMATQATAAVQKHYPDDQKKQQNMMFLFSLVSSASMSLLFKAAHAIIHSGKPDSFVNIQKNFAKDLFDKVLGKEGKNVENLRSELFCHYKNIAEEAIKHHLTSAQWIKQSGELTGEADGIVNDLVKEKVAAALQFFQGEGLASVKGMLLSAAGFSAGNLASGLINSQLNKISFNGVGALKSAVSGLVGGGAAFGVMQAGTKIHMPLEHFTMLTSMYASMAAAMEYFPDSMMDTKNRTIVHAASGAVSAAIGSMGVPLTKIAAQNIFRSRPLAEGPNHILSSPRTTVENDAAFAMPSNDQEDTVTRF